jgi:hypothetical protein
MSTAHAQHVGLLLVRTGHAAHNLALRYHRKARRLQAVDTPQLFQTAYASPQSELWELDDEQWHKISRRPYERRTVQPESELRAHPHFWKVLRRVLHRSGYLLS